MTLLIAIAPLAAAVAIGILLVRALLPQPQSASAVLFLAGCGAAVGLGIDSFLFFAFTMAGMATSVWLGLAQALLLAAVLGLYRKTGRRGPRFAFRRLSLVETIAAVVVSVELVLMLTSFFKITSVNPHGAWDAWSIWNLRAAYLAGGEASWHYAVSKYIILQHPDYPLLTSSVIAHAWTCAHSVSTAVPAVVALMFMLATVFALVTGLVWLRGRMPGLCAGAVLLAVPAWLKLGAAQYADVPLGFYFLVTIVLLCASRIDDRFALLAGVTASLSAWTKDEGLIFTGICLFVMVVLFGPKRALMALAGALPVLLFLFWFKLRIAPGVDPMWRQGAGVVLAKFSAGDRYSLIATQFAKEAAGIPQLFLLPLFGLAIGFKPNRGTLACFAVVGLMLVGYFGYYLITPYPLEWQLGASLDRLYIQLLPGFLFGWFHAGAGQNGDQFKK